MTQNKKTPLDFILAAVLSSILVACTSSRTEEVKYESEDAGALVETELQGLDQVTNSNTDMGEFEDFVSPDVALGETPSDANKSSPSQDWFSGTDSAKSSTSQGSSTSGDSFAADPFTSTDTVATNLGSDTSIGADLATSSTAAVILPAPPAKIPKIEEVPFKRGGILLNAAYITRPGDTFNKISERLYGSKERVRELRRANPSLTYIRGGEIVYYNSPQRPEDEFQLKTYFEEMGLSPEIYVAKEGDNLRTVAKSLLGYARAWREVYSTNRSLDSTQALTAGTQILYWPTIPEVISPQTVSRPSMAQTTPSSPPTSSQGIGELDQPPLFEDPLATTNTPQPMEVPQPMDQGFPNDFPLDDNLSTGSLAPSPPADMNFPPPPPPPPPEPVARAPVPVGAPNQAGLESGVLGLTNDELVTFGGAGALILIGIVLLAVVRKRRKQKELEAVFGDGAANI
jgi:hypothetical protein